MSSSQQARGIGQTTILIVVILCSLAVVMFGFTTPAYAYGYSGNASYAMPDRRTNRERPMPEQSPSSIRVPNYTPYFTVPAAPSGNQAGGQWGGSWSFPRSRR